MLVSIVIPTRNRSEYAVSCAASLAPLDSSLCEIIFHDNSDSPTLGSLLKERELIPRVKYIYHSDALDMVENCHRAVSKATGEYVTLIGDDDTVTPDLLKVAAWASQNDVGEVVTTNPVHYYWPDIRRAQESDGIGRLVIKPFDKSVRKADVRTGLENFLKSGALSLVDVTDLPKLYYGLVRRTQLNEVLSRTGTFFPGISPDLAITASLACLVNAVWVINYPLFLPGSSGKSLAGASARKQHVGRLEDQRHLSPRWLQAWPEEIPRCFTVQTIWGASAATALAEMGREDLRQKINLARLHAECAVLNRAFSRQVVENFNRVISDRRQSRWQAYLAFGYYAGRLTMRRVSIMARRLLRLKSVCGMYRADGASNIGESLRQLNDYLAATGGLGELPAIKDASTKVPQGKATV
jgi:glycosyltransferase involved in cell wall biosynthesis